MTPSVTIDRHGREWVYLSITTDPVLSGWEASADQWATDVTLNTTGAPYTIDGATYTHRVLVAGADCDATPEAGQITLASTTTLEVRATSSPEVTVRTAVRVVIT